MVNKSLSISSTAVQSVEELFDVLSALPPLVPCRKCGSRLMQRNATFFSYGGKVWTATCLQTASQHNAAPSGRRTDTSNSLFRL
jgi:hypothetical protein